MSPSGFIPGNRLLPRPSILEKIAARDAQAPQLIIHHAMQIGVARRAAGQAAAERAVRERRLFDLKNIWAGMAMLGGNGPAYKTPRPEDDMRTLNFAWAETGNNLRTAIIAYMRAHDLDADQLGLDAGERRSLELLDVPRPGLTPE